MKSQRLFYLLVMLTVIAGALGIQPNPTPAAASGRNQEINTLAMSIDNQLSVSGLPGGNGVISPTESAISEIIWNDINSFNSELDAFEASSPENSAVIDGVEIVVTDYYVKVFDPATRPDAEISFQEQMYRDYGSNDTPFLTQLKQELNAVTGLQPIPDSPTLAEAKYQLIAIIEELMAENEGGSPQQVGNAVKNGTSEYIKNNPKIKRKNINRKRVENIIESSVPSQMLPTNGLWKVRPFNVTMTGPCYQTDHYCGDCGGPDNDGEGDPDPGEPLCGFENPGGLPFITWQYAMYMYLPGTTNVYSSLMQIGFSTLSDDNGKTVGSTRYETYVEYEVVSKDRIIVHYRQNYDNGCSYSADYEIVLVTADESVCPDLSSYDPTKSNDEQTPVTVIEGQEPQKPPFNDDDNKAEAIEEPPAVQQGPYKVGMPFSPLEPACTAEGGVPQFTEVELLDQGDGTLRIDYGMGQVMVARNGRTSYTFTNGKAGDELETINLHLDDDGTGSLSWSKHAPSGEACYQTNEIYLPGTGPEAPVVDEPAADEGEDIPAIETAALENGDYGVEWSVMEELCPAAMQPMLPTFSDATVTVIDETNVTLTYEGVEVTLTDVANNGNFGYMDATADPMVSVNLSNMPDYGVMLTWMILPSDGSMCLATAMLN